MSKLCILYGKARGNKVMIGKVYKPDDEVVMLTVEQIEEYFDQFNSWSETPIKNFPPMYIAIKSKYGKDCFKAPVTDWDVVDNRKRNNNFEVQEMLGECYQRSAYHYKFVLSLDVSKGACVLKSRNDEFCKRLMTDKIEKAYIVYVG